MLKRNGGVQQRVAGGPLVNVWLVEEAGRARPVEEAVKVTLPPLEFKLDAEASKGRVTRILVEAGEMTVLHKEWNQQTGAYGEFVRG